MDTKLKHPVAALFIVMALSALTPAYHSGAALTEATTHVIPTAVEPPRSLKALAASHTSVRLAWSAVPGEVTRYDIERKLPDGAFSKVGETTGSECFFIDENLQADPVYIYRVRAVAGGTPSPYSNHANIRIGNAVAFIPAGVRLDPDGKILRESLKNNVGLWGAIDQDDEFTVFQPGDCLDGDFYVGIQLSHDLGDFNTAALWDASLEITMEYDGDSLWTKPLELDNGDQTFLATVFHDKAISCDPDYRFIVREKTANGTVPASNVSLKVLLFEKEANGFSAGEPIVLAHHYNDIKSTVTWSHSREGTASYDLEWVFIAAHENFTGATADSAFKTKEPVRINTQDAFYPHHVFYPEGKVWYRVRAVGMDPDYPGHRINGNWNYGPDAGMAVANSNAGLNWQLQTSFAEGGKYKNMVQYLDGSLRQRQAVTNLNTMEQVLVGETKYDYEGREAVSVLPAPVESQSLAFRPNLNVFTATDPDVGDHTSSQREKFHYDNGSRANSPLGTASGTGKYYSPANDMSVIHRDYLPDAEGFAYSQMTYTRDGTGRIAAQSGVGGMFRTDGGHSTRFYYGEASSEELIRLFGPNVGKASHYKKNMAVDPNGQTSISYVDQEGRTVATALAGEPPTGVVDSLARYRTGGEAATEDPIILPRVPAETERNPDEIREEALAAERERYHGEFLREEKLLLEERYGTEAVPGIPIGSTGTGQIGLMANNLPTAKEYKALMDLYRATNGDSWTNRNGWQDADSLTVQSVAGWKGVAVNGNGNVIWLHLQNNNLSDSLPASIVDLVHLTELVLFGNQLTGPLPDSIGNMAAMAQLQLNNNQFTGGIPPDIRRLANLKILFLQNNQLSDSLPPSLGSLGSLTQINLSNNGIRGRIPPSLGKLSNLVLMSLSLNNLTGPLPDSLGFLSNLTTLRLERNQLEGPLPSSLGNMGNLTEVLLYNNLIRGPIPGSLGRLSKLNKIELANNKLSDPIPDSLGYLGNLTELHLNNNELTGAIPASMGNMKKLKRLLLSQNDLTGELPPSLGNLSELNQLTVYDNEIGGTVPSSFGNLKKLTDLSLSYNNLTGSLPPTLGNLKALKSLKLEFNELEGTLPSGLGQMENLAILDLGYNRFRGPLPLGTENLPLTHFRVWNNFFTFADLQQVKTRLSGQGSYSPQRKTEVPNAYNAQEGKTLTLSATADRETVPATEFRWYRGTQPVNQRSAAGHTVVLENVSAADAGNYYYDSWNSGFPGLTLTSEPQSVGIESPGWKNLTVDLMSHNRKEGNSSVVSKTLLNTVPNTPYSLSYELSGLGTELEGIGCSSCSFELEIMLLNPEGDPVSLGNVAGNSAPDSLSYRNSYTVDDCMVEQTEATVDIGGIVLKDIGDYTVVKELRLLSPTATQAMAEIRNSPIFAGQLAALDTLYNNYGDCEFCTPEDVCPEAEDAIAQAVAETAAMDCENIREMIISDILLEQDSYTEQDIMAHELYCQYQNCIRDMEASIFETAMARIGGWSTAGIYQNMVNEDPFYKASGTGAGLRTTFINAMGNITVGSYTGSILLIIDPTNTAMYYNANGQPDPVNGKHLLYTNLLDQRAAMGETWYQEKLDAQRWMLYRNFYFETSRKIKLGIPAYASCRGSLEALEQMDELPTTEAGMQEWMARENILEPVDSIQVESVLYMLVEGCRGTFTLTESNSLYAHLEAYFNGNRMTNPFNLLLVEDVSSNPHLAAVEAMLDGKGCSLLNNDDKYAFSNPMGCLRDSLVFVGPGQMVPTGGTEEERKIYITEKAPYEALSAPLWESGEQDTTSGTKEEEAEGQPMALMSAPPPNFSEYQVLLALYSATNGSGWSQNEGWSGADPFTPQDVTQWIPQVEVNNGNITGIRLAQNILSGYIPAEIGELEHLEVLELERNFLYGNVPSLIGNLNSLTRLNVSENHLSGNLPQGLSYLNNLTYLNISNNMFEGEIPFDPPPGNSYLLASQNKFTFSDLLPFKNNFFNTASYYIQDSVDVGKNIMVPSGQNLVLTADIDRNTAPASEFQWFKDGVAVNTRSASGHTHTISNASGSHSGDYYYKIWNADLPGLTLTSRVQEVLVYSGQPVRICLEYATGNSQGGYGQPGSNATMEMYSLQKTWTEIVASCVAENQARAGALKDLAEEKLMESWLEEYYAEFDLGCLDDINEKFSYTFTPKEYHYTLYYYDQSGSLVQTVPPKGVQPMGDAQVAQVKAGTRLHPAHSLATRYRYNSRGQLVWQESPDAGESKFWYNKAGQLRLSQDAKQAEANAYSYTKYDRQGRVTETGEMLSTHHLDSLKAKLDNPSFPDPAQHSRHDVTLTGYDRPLAGADPAFTQENLRSRVSWTAMAEKDAADTVFTLYSYDAHGNVNALLQDLLRLGSKKTEYRYDLVSGNVNLVLYQYGRPDQLIHRYSYDADNRIEDVHTSTEGYIWNREARYVYYPHGPLARVELGEYNVQGLDYYYTLQGWLKGVNMPSAGDPGEDGIDGFRTGTDAFAFALGYYEGDYKPVNPNVVVSDSRDQLWNRYRETRDTVSAAGLYNGNISWMSTDLPGLGSNRMQAMVYGYDQLHRIVQARSLTEYGSTGYVQRGTGAEAYDVDYSYDPNGNLLTLQRRDSQTAVQDDLIYEYNTGTNRLRYTNAADGENYVYDEIGNLVSDAEEGISNIDWTPYGKVRAVTKDDNSEVSFRYDASGNRIAKIADGDTTVYVRDASGNVMAIYRNDTLAEQSIYGSSRLGLMTSSSKTGYRTLGGKKYELSNHLGNVLAVVTDNIHLDQDSTWANVVNVTDYYPFGLAMDGRTVQDSSYRYGFNGKERDSNGIGGGGSTYDYGFRIFNPTIGKFLSVDPLTSQYPELTPYQFASNTPIWAIDIDGLEAGYTVSYNVFVDKNGNYVTNRMHEPILTKVNGDWSGIRIKNQFFFNNERYTSQSQVPGWSSWRNLQQEKFNKRVSSITQIASGVVAIAAAIPSGGTSLTLLAALGGSVGISAGSYSVAKGMTDLAISFTNRQEISNKLPDGILNATVGLTITSLIDGEEADEKITATLNIVEGVATLNFGNVTNLQKIDNAINIKNMSVEGINLIDKNNEIENK